MPGRLSSDSLRRQGNVLFSESLRRMEVVDRRRLLHSALHNYKLALSNAESARDRSRCLKNCGVMHKELARLEWTGGAVDVAWQHALDCVDSYEEAASLTTSWSRSRGDAAWLEALATQYANHLELLHSLTLRAATDEVVVHNLHRMCVRLARTDTRQSQLLDTICDIFTDYASRLLRLSVTLNRRREFTQAYKYVAEMHYPLEEAYRLAGRHPELLEYHRDELDELKEDQRIQEVLFHSRVELERSKAFLANLDSEGDRWFDEALVAMDHLKGALGYVEDDWLDVALEAEICSTIGHAYLTLFKAESSAEKFLKRCVELVLCFLSDTPAHCRDERWFATAENGLRTIQERRAERRDDERRSLQLDGTFASLMEHYERGLTAYLTHIYSKHSPGPHAQQPSSKLKARKRVMTALTHFHPDKADKSDRRTYLVREEITKYLNRFHENEKMLAFA